MYKRLALLGHLNITMLNCILTCWSSQLYTSVLQSPKWISFIFLVKVFRIDSNVCFCIFLTYYHPWLYAEIYKVHACNFTDALLLSVWSFSYTSVTLRVIYLVWLWFQIWIRICWCRYLIISSASGETDILFFTFNFNFYKFIVFHC